MLAAGAAGGYFFARRKVDSPVGTVAEEPQEDRESTSEGVFERLIRALPLGVMMLDRTSRVVVANRAAGFIFGFDAKRVQGSHLIEAVLNVEIEHRVEEALRGEASLGPFILPAKNGKRTYTVSAFPVSDSRDQIIGVLVLADDQTEFLSLEKARQDFISNVSHELRTPLSSIKLMLETVIESPDEEAGDLFLPQALVQVDRLAKLVGQLLQQARAQSGELQLRMKEVDLEEVARPIVASFEPQAASKGVTLDLETLRPVKLEADPDRLAQVFVNLIDNALRHTPAGGTVRVRIDADGGDAIVRVRDTGVGIPYRDLPHVFERFYVVDRSRTRQSSGAGLGLSIVKQIVEAHGGTIAAESMLGRGATFTVRLPIMHLKRGRSS